MERQLLRLVPAAACACSRNPGLWGALGAARSSALRPACAFLSASSSTLPASLCATAAKGLGLPSGDLHWKQGEHVPPAAVKPMDSLLSRANLKHSPDGLRPASLALRALAATSVPGHAVLRLDRGMHTAPYPSKGPGGTAAFPAAASLSLNDGRRCSRLPLPHQRQLSGTLLTPVSAGLQPTALVPSVSSRALSTSSRPSLSAHGDEQKREGAKGPDGKGGPCGDATSSPQGTASPLADPIYNLPNAVSAARLVSGPIIGAWLLQGHYEAATIALIISGASDWLDGFLARRCNASSVFGSYLDPLADKVLIGCVAGALLLNGDMPVWLASVVVGRDLLLVSGAFVFRFRGFGWRWPGREAFFRTADVAAPPPAGAATGAGGSAADGIQAGAAASGAGGAGSVSFMKPLLISKANTVLQLLLLGGYLTRGMYGWPEGEPVAALEAATAATTVASLAAYGTMAMQGRLFK